MASGDGGEDSAIVGGDREVAAFVERRLGEAGTVAAHLAAAHAATKHPHHIAVAVVGAAIAVFVRGAAEFRYDDNDRVVPVRPQSFRQAANPSPSGGSRSASWPLSPPPAMRVPPTERNKGLADVGIARQKAGQPRCPRRQGIG